MAALPLLAVVLTGCGAKMPDDVGVGPLAPCPSTPNCVSSVEPQSSDAWVEPLELDGPPDRAWLGVREELESWPRLRIVEATEDAIHAEATSAVFRFEDDLELRLRAGEGRIDVRSASRIGRSDLGANRRRVEKLREALVERGVVAPGEMSREKAP